MYLYGYDAVCVDVCMYCTYYYVRFFLVQFFFSFRFSK